MYSPLNRFPCQSNAPARACKGVSHKFSRVSLLLYAEPPHKGSNAVVQRLHQLGQGLSELGPIGLSLGGGSSKAPPDNTDSSSAPACTGNGNSKSSNKGSRTSQQSSLSELGPIGLTLGGSESLRSNNGTGSTIRQTDEAEEVRAPSISSLTTEEWRTRYEKEDGTVDLWLEDEYNAGSRLVGGRAVHNGGVAGFRTGEGGTAGDAPVHKVTITDHYSGREIVVQVPEDRYILWEAEEMGLQLPWACRMGCCTACAVRIKEGEMYQPEALGISAELRAAGYGLMCVGYPSSDLVMETVTEDEVYELQFGKSFETQALDPAARTIDRDDFALSMANMDE